jgi:hypothetical protein
MEVSFEDFKRATAAFERNIAIGLFYKCIVSISKIFRVQITLTLGQISTISFHG